MKAVKQVAEYDSFTQTFRKPTLAKKPGHYLQKCANMVITNARKNRDNERKQLVTDFLETYKDEWTDLIGSKAYESQSEAKYNKVERLPLVEDVQKLTKYIEEEIRKTLSEKHNGNEQQDISKLSQLCLTQVLLFNRRRAGEAQRLKTEAYQKACVTSTPVDKDVKKCLSKFEQELCENHTRV